MDALSQLINIKKLVDNELLQYFNSNDKLYKSHSPFYHSMFLYIKEFTLRGGKRFRPSLFYYTYKALGGKTSNRDIIKLSIFLELIQTFLLIHDDIIDNSNLRRGGNTIHKIYENYAIKRKYKNEKEFGVNFAILAGDVACQMAFEIISKSKNIDNCKLLELINIVTKYLLLVVAGQNDDLLLSYQARYTKEDILKVHEYKTAHYTFYLPIIAASVLTNTSKKNIKYLNNYCKYAGIAYQVNDDILGVFGSDKVTGKDCVSDIIENKRTLLTLIASKYSSRKDKETLKSILGNCNIGKDDIDKVKEIMIKSKALEYSKKLNIELINKARINLKKVEFKNDYSYLDNILEYLIYRDK